MQNARKKTSISSKSIHSIQERDIFNYKLESFLCVIFPTKTHKYIEKASKVDLTTKIQSLNSILPYNDLITTKTLDKQKKKTMKLNMDNNISAITTTTNNSTTNDNGEFFSMFLCCCVKLIDHSL